MTQFTGDIQSRYRSVENHAGTQQLAQLDLHCLLVRRFLAGPVTENMQLDCVKNLWCSVPQN